MKYRHLAAALVVFIGPVCTASDQHETILIDFGHAGLRTSGEADFWNNVSSARLGPSPDSELEELDGEAGANLRYADGSDSGIQLSAIAIGDTRVSGGGADFTGTLPASPTGTSYPLNAYTDNMFSGEDGSYTVTLSNLDPELAYDFTFLTAFDGGFSNGDAVWTITQGSGAVLSVTNDVPTSNAASFVQLLSIAPAQNGIIEIEMNPAAAGTIARWNTVEITETVPSGTPPAAFDYQFGSVRFVNLRDDLGMGRFEIAEAGEGERPFIDEDIVITSLPSELAGRIALRTRNSEAVWPFEGEGLSAAETYLAFEVDRDTTVFVINHPSSEPAWLTSSFTSTGMTVETTEGVFDVWERGATARELVVLPGNAGVGEDLNYWVVLAEGPDAITEIPDGSMARTPFDDWTSGSYSWKLTKDPEADSHIASLSANVGDFSAEQGFRLTSTVRVPRLQEVGENSLGFHLLGQSVDDVAVFAEWLPRISGGGSLLRLVDGGTGEILAEESWTGLAPTRVDNNVGVSDGASEVLFAAGTPVFVDDEESITFAENFETGGQGWITGSNHPAVDQWEIGVPSSGPGAAFSGGNVAATNLEGFYTSGETEGTVAWLRSPLIDLRGVGGATLRFREYLDVDTFTSNGELLHFATVRVLDGEHAYLKYADGADSGIGFSAQGAGDTRVSGAAVDFTGTLPAGPTGTAYPFNAYTDNMFSGTGGSYTVQLNDLDTDLVYDFTFLSAFNAGVANGSPAWTITKGTGTELSVTNEVPESDAASFVQLTEIAPTQEGVIEIEMAPAESGTNARWNTLEITAREVGSAQHRTILIDFGFNGRTTTGEVNHWNNVSSVRLGPEPDPELQAIDGAFEVLAEVAPYHENILSWAEREMDLTGVVGNRVILEFALHTDAIEQAVADGWYIDDVEVLGSGVQIKSLPEELTLDGTLFGIAAERAGVSDASENHLQFTVADRGTTGNEGVTVYVAWDIRASGLEPDWLTQSFDRTDHFVEVRGEAVFHRLWAREYDDGAQVTLGGASAAGPGAAGLPGGTNNYFVLLGDSRAGLESFYSLESSGEWVGDEGILTFALTDENGVSQTVETPVSGGFGGHNVFGVAVRHPNPSGETANFSPMWEISSFSFDGFDPIVAPASGFQQWREANFEEGELDNLVISGPNADPSGDGVPNLVKYALDLSPWVAASAGDLPRLVDHEDYNLVISYQERNDITDIVYGVEASEDLLTWEDGEPHVMEIYRGAGNAPNMEEVRVRGRMVEDAPRGFLRLKIRQVE